MSIYLSDTTDPYFNLATEDWLYHEVLTDQPLLYLWRNQKTVVIGRAQNPWVECNVKAMEDNEVLLARRQSGGGTVFHDLGNTNFTFLAPKDQYDKNQNLQIIVDALASFGISAEASGRNDILVDGKKVSGSAFRESKDRAFHHGTLLLNANLSELSNYLNPSVKKLKAKGVKSVRSRVMNLSEQNLEINHESICQAILQQFFKQHGASDIIHLDHAELSAKPELQSRYEQLKDWEWRFGKTLNFEHEFSERFDWGEITVQLNVNHAKIIAARIFSDTLFPEFLESIAQQLVGLSYQPETIKQIISEVSLQGDTETIRSDLANWISTAIS